MLSLSLSLSDTSLRERGGGQRTAGLGGVGDTQRGEKKQEAALSLSFVQTRLVMPTSTLETKKEKKHNRQQQQAQEPPKQQHTSPPAAYTAFREASELRGRTASQEAAEGAARAGEGNFFFARLGALLGLQSGGASASAMHLASSSSSSPFAYALVAFSDSFTAALGSVTAGAAALAEANNDSIRPCLPSLPPSLPPSSFLSVSLSLPLPPPFTRTFSLFTNLSQAHIHNQKKKSERKVASFTFPTSQSRFDI